MDVSNMSISGEDTFVRQRRNLVIASTFIAIYAASELKIEKLNFILASGEINDASALLWFVWGIGAYFLYRYHTVNSRDLWRGFFNQINNTYERSLLDAAAAFVRIEYESIDKSNYIEEFNNLISDTVRVEELRIQTLNKEPIILSHMYDAGNLKNHISINTRAITNIIGQKVIVVADKTGEGKSVLIPIRISELVQVKAFMRALIKNIFESSFFGERIFPYVFFVTSSCLYLFKILKSESLVVQSCT